MSQTKVKSRMYASKLLTERSPVVKRVMVAETNTDAADSFCDAPDGTGHRDMAHSESSARELGRPVPAQSGGRESYGAVVAVKRVMTVERRAPACMVFQTGTAERDCPARTHCAKRRMTMYPESDYGWCDAPRSAWEKLAAKADAESWVRLRGITNMSGSGGSPALQGNARTCGRAESGERRRPARATRGTRT